MTETIDAEFLISTITLAVILAQAIYHANLYLFNRIKFLAKYTLYLWFSFAFLLTRALNGFEKEMLGELFPYLIVNVLFWLTIWFYFSFVIASTKTELIKNKFTLLTINYSWVLVSLCSLAHILKHMMLGHETILNIFVLLTVGGTLTCALVILFVAFKQRRDFFNLNLIVGNVAMLTLIFLVLFIT